MLKILNGSPGIGAPLNEQETVDFLTTGKLNIHLGTVDEKGEQMFILHGTIMILEIIGYMLKHQNREGRHPTLERRGMFTFVLMIPIHLIKARGAKEV